MRRRRYYVCRPRRRNPPLTKTLTSWPFLLVAAGGLWLYLNRASLAGPRAGVSPGAGQTFQLPGGGTARLPPGTSSQTAALIQAAAKAASGAWPTNWPTTSGNDGTIYQPSGGYDPTVWGGDTTDWGGGIDTGAVDITLGDQSQVPVYEAP